jgi:methanogenic corrinoid protein MtbC1
MPGLIGLGHVIPSRRADARTTHRRQNLKPWETWMSSSTSQRVDFCRDEYEQASGRAASLFSALPPEAVRSVAEEALVRLAARSKTPDQKPAKTPSPTEISELCQALMSADPGTAAQRVQDALAGGATVADVYLQHLAPAARQLGAWWSDDQVSFVQVTVATARIFAILRTLDVVGCPPRMHTTRTAVFAAVPGETHTLGVRMAADLFRRKGWDIRLEIGLPHDALVDRMTAMEPLLIGLSAAGAHAASSLARLVVALRMTVPAPLIVVSGQIVIEARDIVEAISPDAIVSEMDEAEAVFTGLWDERIACPGQAGRPGT